MLFVLVMYMEVVPEPNIMSDQRFLMIFNGPSISNIVSPTEASQEVDFFEYIIIMGFFSS